MSRPVIVSANPARHPACGRAGGRRPAILAAVRAALAAGPVVVAVDDVQWLDAESLEALTFALRQITTGPLSLLLAARTEARPTR